MRQSFRDGLDVISGGSLFFSAIAGGALVCALGFVLYTLISPLVVDAYYTTQTGKLHFPRTATTYGSIVESTGVTAVAAPSGAHYRIPLPNPRRG
ncbi:hypothetical protein JXR01_01930 [Candidatus Kaiserbacteria bacterium]|nr:MAG: hypothetical protein JXR01_01930 [Candidatus Kaiserbacteria bacterium]